MNIDTSSKKIGATTRTASSTQTRNDSSSTGFADELSSMSSQKKEESNEASKIVNTSDEAKKVETDDNVNNNSDNMDDVIDGLEVAVAEINDKLNQADDGANEEMQKSEEITNLNNDVNFPAGLNFQDIEVISTFQMNSGSDNDNENQQKRQNAAKQITTLTQGLEDENVNVLAQNDDNSTEESLKEDVSRVKTVTNSSGIKKVDTKSNITIETVASFDDIAMNKNDVDFFTKLVESGQNGISTKETAEASQVSKTLADMLAKSMNDNKPIRINFDNDISVIIKVGKDGKISADFLPSSQVAEAYLKENLPLLRQKFDDNNIDYDELNHRGQKQNEKDENQKKGRKDE